MEGSRLRWKPPFFLRSRPTYPRLMFSQLPGANNCQAWSSLILIAELQRGRTSCLGKKFLAKQSSTAVSLVSPEYRAFKTCIGWVLNGEARDEGRQSLTYVCCVALNDNDLRRFWEIEDHYLEQAFLSHEEKAVVEQFEMSHAKTKMEDSLFLSRRGPMSHRSETLGPKHCENSGVWNDRCS